MDRRTFEGPMDWEYHSRGPVDPTSPFAQAAQGNGLRNGFASPTKELGSSRPSSAFSSPSKNQQPRPPLFMPQQNVSGPPAPAFRNPAFTTPRKPFDHVVLSEASDLDDSPARTEASDLPNDTPEADRMSDVNMGGTITPAKIDKTFRYSRGASSRRHMPGRGEIRTHRDLGTHDAWRKKRHQDRDARHGRRQSEDSEDESDAGIGFADRGRHGTRPKADKGQDRRRGMIGSVFHMMEEHNTAPENLYRWMQLGINVFIGGLFCAVVFSVVHTIRSDINAVNEAARQEIRVKMAACQDEYMANGCANTDAPAFKKMCSEWYDCMMQNPDSIVRVRATMTEVANIMNDFFGTLNLKAWGAVVAIVAFTLLANNTIMVRHPAATMPAPSARSDVPKGPPGEHVRPSSAGDIMWIPVQTPRRRNHRIIDEETDTDGTPPSSQKMLPPFTPSGRRSPSKRERSISPIKYARSPRKMY